MSCLQYATGYTGQPCSVWQETTQPVNTRGENLGGGLLQPGTCKDSSNYYLSLVFICMETEILVKVLSKPKEVITNLGFSRKQM